MSTLSFFVPGTPKGQPRVRACIRGKRAGVYDPGSADDWKRMIASKWAQIKPKKLNGPVRVNFIFWFARPKSHFKSGKKSTELRPDAPTFHTQKPDADNLAKANCDILTQCGAWDDDAQIASMTVVKMWNLVQGDPSGCQINIDPI